MGDSETWLRLCRFRSSLGVLAGVLTTLLVTFVDVPKISLPFFQPEPTLIYPEDHQDYVAKGLPSLTLEELELEHSSSLDLLESYSKTWTNTDSGLAEGLLDQIETLEQGSSLHTRSILLTLRGRQALEDKDYPTAIRHLEEAVRLSPSQNCWAPLYLFKAYNNLDERLRSQPLPWSSETQEQIRDLGEKLERLELTFPFLVSEILILEQQLNIQWAETGSATLVERFVPEGLNVDAGAGGAPGHRLAALRLNRWANQNAFFDDLVRGNPADVGGCAENADVVVDNTGSFACWWPPEGLNVGLPGQSLAARNVAGDGPDSAKWAFSSSFPTAFQSVGHTRALVVGINEYDAPVPPLRYAARDAERVARALEEAGVESVVLRNAAATKDTILQRLMEEVLRSRSTDRLVLYFSGHGVTVGGERALLIDGGRAVITLREVAEVLSYHQGTTTVIADSCFNTRELNLRSNTTKPGDALGGNETGFFLGTSPGGIAVESQQLRGGVFTEALLGALRHEGDNALDLVTLVEDTAGETGRLAADLHGVEQRPVLFWSNGTVDPLTP